VPTIDLGILRECAGGNGESKGQNRDVQDAGFVSEAVRCFQFIKMSYRGKPQ
jgi:hypothetical protein